MDAQVLVREKMIHNNVTRVVPATVISREGDLLTVRVQGERQNKVVSASETLPMTKVTGSHRHDPARPMQLLTQSRPIHGSLASK